MFGRQVSRLFLTLQVIASYCGVDATARLELRLRSYENGREHDYSGACCDLACWGKCDHKFVFCLGGYNSAYNTNDCSYFKRSTGHFQDQNVNNFGADIRGVSNPLVKDFTRWPGGVFFKVRVDDDDVNSDDLVDNLYKKIQMRPAASANDAGWTAKDMTGVRPRDKTILRMDVRVYCLANYYGADCGTYCLPRDDVRGHYWCDQVTGDPICRPGWEDPRTKCTIFSDDCRGVTCHNGGTCRDGNRRYTCDCMPGFAGRHCETNIDECSSTPCQNNGSCTDVIDGYTCQCDTAYVGLQCQGHVCNVESPCLNGGTCYGTGQCLCPPAYTTDDCGVHFCDVKNCENGGTCVNETGQCLCPEGFTGHVCDNYLCSTVECQFGGTCVNGQCLCAPGFTGRYCHTMINYCISDPCENDSPCRSSSEGYTCQCSHGYNGTRCEHYFYSNNTELLPPVEKIVDVDNPDTFPKLGLIGIAAVALIIIIIIVGVLLWRRRKSKMAAASHNPNVDSFANPVYASDEGHGANTSELVRPNVAVANDYARVGGATAAEREHQITPKANVYDEVDLLKAAIRAENDRKPTDDGGYMEPSQKDTKQKQEHELTEGYMETQLREPTQDKDKSALLPNEAPYMNEDMHKRILESKATLQPPPLPKRNSSSGNLSEEDK